MLCRNEESYKYAVALNGGRSFIPIFKNLPDKIAWNKKEYPISMYYRSSEKLEPVEASNGRFFHYLVLYF